jgi:hypothetical protein
MHPIPSPLEEAAAGAARVGELAAAAATATTATFRSLDMPHMPSTTTADRRRQMSSTAPSSDAMASGSKMLLSNRRYGARGTGTRAGCDGIGAVACEHVNVAGEGRGVVNMR